MIPFSAVEADVRTILQRYAPNWSADSLDQLICGDVGLGTRQYAAFISEVGIAMRLALRAWLQDRTKPPTRPPWWKRLAGAQAEPALRDISVRELCEYVCAQRRIRSDNEEAESRRRYGPPRSH